MQLRQGPDASFPVAAHIGSGPRLIVVGRTADSRWLHVCCIGTLFFWVAVDEVEVGNDVSAVPELTPLPTPTRTPTPTWTPTPTRTRTPTPSPTPRLIELTSRATISASATAPDGQNRCTPPGTTSYSVTNLVDGKPDTAWRVEGDAAGVYIDIRFAEPVVLQELRMIPGYAKTDPCDTSLYWCIINRIPKRVRLTFDNNVSRDITLEEQCELQRITWEQPQTTRTVRIEVLDTYPPSSTVQQRDFTPISDIQLWGYVP